MSFHAWKDFSQNSRREQSQTGFDLELEKVRAELQVARNSIEGIKRKFKVALALMVLQAASVNIVRLRASSMTRGLSLSFHKWREGTRNRLMRCKMFLKMILGSFEISIRKQVHCKFRTWVTAVGKSRTKKINVWKILSHKSKSALQGAVKTWVTATRYANESEKRSTARSQQMLRVLRRIQARDVLGAWLRWRGAVARLHEQSMILKRASKVMAQCIQGLMNQEMTSAWQTWKAVVSVAAFLEVKEGVVMRLLEHQKKRLLGAAYSRLLQTMRDAKERRKLTALKSHQILRVLRHIQAREMASSWRGWQDAVVAILVRKSQMDAKLGMMIKVLQGKSGMWLSKAWRVLRQNTLLVRVETAQNFRFRGRLLRRVAFKIYSLRIACAWRTWINCCSLSRASLVGRNQAILADLTIAHQEAMLKAEETLKTHEETIAELNEQLFSWKASMRSLGGHLHQEALRQYLTVKKQLRARGASWSDLTPSEERKMNQVTEMLKGAAENGHAQAQCNLGCMYAGGQGVEKNDFIALQWFRKASEQGEAQAQYNLGGMYAHGRGIIKNPESAVIWFRRAAEQGHVDAQCSLGRMYATGEGVETNYPEATRWYELSKMAMKKR
eukprot:CAMPEP_0172652146 /NCGR_PEP_ID=MMETSP1068-20121228/243168_1 /TAXON_ID=35684 /ORGANISM="Pseudopedinella elastica, Strain CCMP716" /LENGTH=612 /DNA_ID=CAMNT_0013466551 /DNA_START=537 /DNA_END=2375 /DNA_ORIENTATION=-